MHVGTVLNFRLDEDKTEEAPMRYVTILSAAFAALSFAAVSSIPAQAYMGPKRNGEQCWVSYSHQGGGTVGHWEQCPSETKNTAVRGSGRHGHRNF